MRIPSWRSSGREPDYRFSLANERTFLAWIRTALSLLAGGVLLEQFATRLEPRFVVVGLAIALAVLSSYRLSFEAVRTELVVAPGRPLPITAPLGV